MKRLLLILFLLFALNPAGAQTVPDSVLREWNGGKKSGDCGKCWTIVPAQAYRKNSPFFDSSIVKTRNIAFAKSTSNFINFSLIHDSIDYINLGIYQKTTGFTVHTGQEINIMFYDSTKYKIIVPSVTNSELETRATFSYFQLVLTDSLRKLFLTSPIKGVWVSNQKSFPKKPDRYFKSFLKKSKSIKFFTLVFCCFDRQKRLHHIN